MSSFSLFVDKCPKAQIDVICLFSLSALDCLEKDQNSSPILTCVPFLSFSANNQKYWWHCLCAFSLSSIHPLMVSLSLLPHVGLKFSLSANVQNYDRRALCGFSLSVANIRGEWLYFLCPVSKAQIVKPMTHVLSVSLFKNYWNLSLSADMNLFSGINFNIPLILS